MARIYLDYAATTYVREEVLAAMQPFFSQRFGNPSATYGSAREAKNAIENARSTIARILGARYVREIYFTSGGTESNNWALDGMVDVQGRRHIVTTNAEHHSVLSKCEGLRRQGYRVTFLPVDARGRVSAAQVADAVDEDTALVSIMLANNEVGVLNPIREIGAVLRERGIPFHTDAVAAAGHMRICARDCDLLSISAHKFYGPKGVGALYVSNHVKLRPFVYGGQQERGMRAGTENVAGIVGMATALELADVECEREQQRLRALRDYAKKLLGTYIADIQFNGYEDDNLAQYLNICLPVPANAVLLALDMEGVECASGSACMAGGVEPSHVLMAMGLPRERAQCALRITFGADSTHAHVDMLTHALRKICGNSNG